MALWWAYKMRRLFVYAAMAMLGMAMPAVAAPNKAGEVHILAFGDSLIAGYGLPQGQGFVPQLERSLRRSGMAASVINAGVSGDTSAAGRARVGWTLAGLKRKPDLAIIALGGNDMLRGISPQQTRANMDAILAEFHRRKIKVVIAGMVAAPNLGQVYGARFNKIYPDLARKYNMALYPFFLDGVAGNRNVLLADGMHPNFQGVKRMVAGILPTIRAALKR